MRWSSRAVAIAVALLIVDLGAGAPATGIADGVLAVGIRLGYAFGRGWIVGPGVSVNAWVRTTGENFVTRDQLGLLVGLAASGDVSLGEHGALDFRVHVGPEVGVTKACPTVASTLTGGVVWALRRGAPARLGFQGGVSLLGDPVDHVRHDLNPLFVGLAYRYAELSGEGTHEVDLDTRVWALPFQDAPYRWVRFCGLLGGEPNRFN